MRLDGFCGCLSTSRLLPLSYWSSSRWATPRRVCSRPTSGLPCARRRPVPGGVSLGPRLKLTRACAVHGPDDRPQATRPNLSPPAPHHGTLHPTLPTRGRCRRARLARDEAAGRGDADGRAQERTKRPDRLCRLPCLETRSCGARRGYCPLPASRAWRLRLAPLIHPSPRRDACGGVGISPHP
jgi:hypothetical protein